MRFKHFLRTINETPIFNDDNLNLGSDKESWKNLNKNYVITKDNTNGEDIDIGDDFYIMSNNNKTFVTYDDNVVLFAIHHLEKINNRNIFFIDSISVKPEFRGKGLALKTYNFLLNKHGSIGSDNELTGKDGVGSIGIWKKLAEKNVVYEIEDTIDDVSITRIKELRLVSHNSRFVIFKDTI